MDRIDIVIPWVDDQDIIWKKERSLYITDFNDDINTVDKFYRDWGTLLYVFRGIEKFMPWVGKIFLLTYGHTPSWLNINHSKINIVKHSDFFLNQSDLPTYSASSIESNLLGIKGLSDKFIYFNDDTLVLKETPISRFFKNGLPVDFLIENIPRRGFLYRKLISNDTYVDTVINCLRLVNNHFSKWTLIKKQNKLYFNKSYGILGNFKNLVFSFCPNYVWFSSYHFQQPYLKSSLEEANALFPDEMKATSSHRFRDRGDINQYIYRFIRLSKGEFYPYKPTDTLGIVLDSYTSFMKYKHKIANARFFCPNDSSKISPDDFIRTKDELERILNEILPEKSSFEI